MKRLSLLLIFSLFACQASPNLSANRQAPRVQAQLSTSTPWQAYAQLDPTQQLAIEQALSRPDRAANPEAGPEGLGRELIQKLVPLLKNQYQYMLHPRTIHSDRLPPGAQSVSLRSHDGIPLQGFWLSAQRPTKQALIIVHGYQLNKYMAWEKYGFLQAEYNLLFVDLRGHNSQDGAVTLGILEQRDLLASMEWLAQQKQNQFGLFGESMGAATAIVAGAKWVQSPQQNSFPLMGVWSDAAYADLNHAIEERVFRKLAADSGITPEQVKLWAAHLISQTYLNWLAQDTGVSDAELAAAPRHYLPQLLQHSAYGQVHSREDEQTSYQNAEILQQQAQSQSGFLSQFWPTAGRHVESYRQPEYRQRALAFFKQAFNVKIKN